MNFYCQAVMEGGRRATSFFYMSDLVAAFWFLLPTAHTSVLSSLNTHFHHTPLPHTTYQSNCPFISKLVLRAPHATYHSNCPFISKLVLPTPCPVVLLFEKRTSSQASHHFGGRSVCNLPYHPFNIARHLSPEQTHYSSIFLRQHSILLYAFTVFISIAFALRLGRFLILVQH